MFKAECHFPTSMLAIIRQPIDSADIANVAHGKTDDSYSKSHGSQSISRLHVKCGAVPTIQYSPASAGITFFGIQDGSYYKVGLQYDSVLCVPRFEYPREA